MGATPYQYVVDYENDVQEALNKLRQKVFESGEFNGADLNPGTPEEALEMTEEEGTASILDIAHISTQPECFAASPFSVEELQTFFGTDKPTVETMSQADAFWDSIERGTARYVILYDNNKPNKIFFAGYSFD